MDALDPHQIEAIHPDDFVLNQLELRPFEALAAIKKMRARLSRPPRSAAELIATLERSGPPDRERGAPAPGAGPDLKALPGGSSG